ncbi:MAG: MoaD/ThiS family protein [Cyclobacteriaceae bacterium]|nr:MoaD/ThiS family protein [Cyclobacteriaceae bacterium HetDA_MAG_MS6]
MATIIIPTPLRKFTENQSKVVTKGDTVQESIHSLTNVFPELKKHVLNDDGSIKQFVRIYLEDEDINVLDKEETKVESNSTISIIPAIAGGAI